MLRITIHERPGFLTLQLEGKLVGPWVRELGICWQNALASQPRASVCFDLTAVTYVDTPGKEFLAARHAEGAEFRACGCLMKAVVAEITETAAPAKAHCMGESTQD